MRTSTLAISGCTSAEIGSSTDSSAGLDLTRAASFHFEMDLTAGGIVLQSACRDSSETLLQFKYIIG